MYAPMTRGPANGNTRGPRAAAGAAGARRRPLFQASPSFRTNGASIPAGGNKGPHSTTANSTIAGGVSYQSLLANKPVRVQRPSSKLIRQPMALTANAAPAPAPAPAQRRRPAAVNSYEADSQTLELPPSPLSGALTPSPTTMSHRLAAMEILASPNPRAGIVVQAGELALLSAASPASGPVAGARPSKATRALDAALCQAESEAESEAEERRDFQRQVQRKQARNAGPRQQIRDSYEFPPTSVKLSAKPVTKGQKIFNRMQRDGHLRSGHQRTPSDASTDSTASDASSTMSEQKRARTRAVIVDAPRGANGGVKLRHAGGRTESISSEDSAALMSKRSHFSDKESESGESCSTYSASTSSDEQQSDRDFACDSDDFDSSSSSESESSSGSSSDASTLVRQGTATRVARTPLHARQQEMQVQQEAAMAKTAAAAAVTPRKPASPPMLHSDDVAVSILDDTQLEEAYLARDELIERIRLRLVHAFPSLIECDSGAAEALQQRAEQLEIEIEEERQQDVIRGQVVVESRAQRYVRTPTVTEAVTPKASQMRTAMRSPAGAAFSKADLSSINMPSPSHTACPGVWELPIETSSLYKRRSQANKAAASKIFQLPEFDQVVACASCDGKRRMQCPTCCGIPPDECRSCDGSGMSARGNGICKRCDGQGFRACGSCSGHRYVNCDGCSGAGEYEAQYEVEVTQSIIELPASRVEDFGDIRGNALASPIELIDTAKQQIAAAAQTLADGSVESAAKSPIAATCIWQSTIMRVVSVRIPDEEDINAEVAPNTVTVRIFLVPADLAMPIEEVTDDDDIFDMVSSQIQAREMAPDRYEQRPPALNVNAPEQFDDDEELVATPRPAGVASATAVAADDEDEYESSEDIYNVYLQRSPGPVTAPANKVRFVEEVESIPSPVLPLHLQQQQQFAAPLLPMSPVPLLPLSPSPCPRRGAKYDAAAERDAALPATSARANTTRAPVQSAILSDDGDTAAVLAFLNQQQETAEREVAAQQQRPAHTSTRRRLPTTPRAAYI